MALFSLYVGGMVLGHAIFKLAHVDKFFSFYNTLLGRGITFFVVGGGSWTSVSSVASIIPAIVTLVLAVVYIIGHWVTAIPEPVPLMATGSCSPLSFVLTPIAACCKGRGAIGGGSGGGGSSSGGGSGGARRVAVGP